MGFYLTFHLPGLDVGEPSEGWASGLASAIGQETIRPDWVGRGREKVLVEYEHLRVLNHSAIKDMEAIIEADTGSDVDEVEIVCL